MYQKKTILIFQISEIFEIFQFKNLNSELNPKCQIKSKTSNSISALNFYFFPSFSIQNQQVNHLPKALTCDYKYKKVLIKLSLKSNISKLYKLLNYFNSFIVARFRYLNFDIIFIKLIQGNMSVDKYGNKLKALIMRVNKKFFG